MYVDMRKGVSVLPDNKDLIYVTTPLEVCTHNARLSMVYINTYGYKNSCWNILTVITHYEIVSDLSILLFWCLLQY